MTPLKTTFFRSHLPEITQISPKNNNTVAFSPFVQNNGADKSTDSPLMSTGDAHVVTFRQLQAAVVQATHFICSQLLWRQRKMLHARQVNM